MHLFLTSSPCGCPYNGSPRAHFFDPANYFVDHLREVWPSKPVFCLILAAYPEDFSGNDAMADYFADCLQDAELPVSKVVVCDNRNAAAFPELISHAGFVLLSGGHVPTENRFFRRLSATYYLRSFGGIVLSISAGSMNAADPVYAEPEEPGEAVDPSFRRWLPGLGLTDINVMPHFQETRRHVLDGLRLLEDIALPDSFTRPILALPDGSYVYIHEGHATLFGKAYLLQNGQMEQICEDRQWVDLD